MKTFQLIMISFFLITVTTLDLITSEGNDVVYDSEGEPLKTNVPYYITFMTSDYDMWICRLKTGSTNPKSCPQQPLMFTHPTIQPTPVTFHLSSSSSSTSSSASEVVHESTELRVKFMNPSHCDESGFWRVVQNSTSLESEVVLNGSKSSDDDSVFTIHKTNEFYMFSVGDKSLEPTTISLSYEPAGGIQRLIAKRFSGEMEVYFYRTMI